MLNITQMILIFLIAYLLMNYSCPSQKIENFDANCYLNAFPDVKSAGVDALKHYNDHGKKEIENGTRTKPNCDLSTGSTNQPTPPPVARPTQPASSDFNCQCYLDKNPDLPSFTIGIPNCDWPI